MATSLVTLFLVLYIFVSFGTHLKLEKCANNAIVTLIVLDPFWFEY